MQRRFSNITKAMLKELPRWFKMRYDESSTGAQFMNIFGLQFEDIEFYLNYAFQNQYIDSADIDQVDIIYKATLPASVMPDNTMKIVGEGMYLQPVESLKQFFHGIDLALVDRQEIYYPNPFVVDWVRKLIYVKRAYGVDDVYPEGKIRLILSNKDKVTITEVEIPTNLHHVWNFFDEFGLLLDTPRLYGEKNREYKERLLDVFRHPANSSMKGLQYSLARELGLWIKEAWMDAGLDMTIKHANVILDSIEVSGIKWPKSKIKTDASDRVILVGNLEDLGKQKEVKFIAGLEMHTFFNKTDYAFQEELYSVDRLATPMLQYYVDVITNQVPVMWDQFIWNESFWDIADAKMSGYGYIPSFNDARFLNWSKYKN